MVHDIGVVVFGNGRIYRHILSAKLQDAYIHDIPFRAVGHGDQGNLIARPYPQP